MFPETSDIANDILACNSTAQLRQIRDSWHRQLQDRKSVV